MAEAITLLPLGVGTGVFLVALVWIVALVLGIVLCRASGPTNRLGVVAVFLLALAVTLALVFFPRSSETPSPFEEKEIVDRFFIGRYVLLAVTSLILLVAFFTLMPHHILEPVHAKPLRTR